MVKNESKETEWTNERNAKHMSTTQKKNFLYRRKSRHARPNRHRHAPEICTDFFYFIFFLFIEFFIILQLKMYGNTDQKENE